VNIILENQDNIWTLGATLIFFWRFPNLGPLKNSSR
jgi:hypothetical protein